jgi:spermidine/putrescine transport system substrate-binding protein
VLTADVALDNFAWVGYQPPQVGLTPEKMVDGGFVPEALTTAIVRPENFRTGYRLLELPPEVDSQWQQVWQQFKAGG